MKQIPLSKEQAASAKILVGEWYLISNGSLKGYYCKHLHTKNVVIIAEIIGDVVTPWLYIENESTVLN